LAACTLTPDLPYRASSVAESADQHDWAADDDRDSGVLNRVDGLRHGDQGSAACALLVHRAGRGRAVRDGGCRRDSWYRGGREPTAGGL